LTSALATEACGARRLPTPHAPQQGSAWLPSWLAGRTEEGHTRIPARP